MLGLLLSSSVFSEQMYSPICYKDRLNKREVVLIGVNHFHRYRPHADGVVEKLIDASDLVYFENSEVLPKDGVFTPKMAFPEEAKQTIRLDRFVEMQDIPRLSQLFGMSYLPETSIPPGAVVTFVESILAKQLVQAAGSNDSYKRNPFIQVIGSYNVESASYAYALANKVQVRDLETVSETFAAPEFHAIKKEVGRVIECAQSDVCMQEYKAYTDKRIAYYATDAESSYDYMYQISVGTPGAMRATIVQRNERMAQRLLTSLPNEKKALVIVGAAHVGGPTGLASKLESAKFIKVKCKP